ncbi:tyrosine-type recombinase/integrase [Novipirellula aureliae]|uniref:tyrosine-type recombinase/integrase n=1 Tax=Novipirellula aureliae TaxID=2527966 RepID=UPI0011B47DB8|nr:tyrosine-type recombinase/integrase [Novipirellula aureliae]
MNDSTRPKKPNKPYPDFPLYPHNSKRWAKKINKRTHYFGPWDDWKGALERWQYENDYLQQGKTPPPRNVEALTVEDMVNGLLEHREAKVFSGELSRRTWLDYRRVGRSLIKDWGRYRTVESLTPSDFQKLREKYSKKLQLIALGDFIRRTKTFFNFAYKQGLIEHPVRFGLGFEKPSRKSIKKAKQAKPAKIFTIEELQTLYREASPQMQTFMLLALNCGFGNSDIGQLEGRHIDGQWMRSPRPKTSVERDCPLWAETKAAIEATRQTSKPDCPLVFLTKRGLSWHKDEGANPLSAEFRKLCIACGLHQKGRGFYSLRHQFRTVADGSRDRAAIDRIMGHSDDSMGAMYVEWIEPDRLQAVVDHVYQWVKPMFAESMQSEGGEK